MPVTIAHRHDHSAVAFGRGPYFRVLAVFGGRHGVGQDVVSETTLLLLSKKSNLHAGWGRVFCRVQEIVFNNMCS